MYSPRISREISSKYRFGEDENHRLQESERGHQHCVYSPLTFIWRSFLLSVIDIYYFIKYLKETCILIKL